MGRVVREHLVRPLTLRLLLRGLLLALVLAGIFGMHVLTADDGVTGHGALPTVGVADGMTEHDAASSDAGAMTAATENADTAAQLVVAAAVLEPDPGSGMDHGAMAGCILFLAVGVAAVVLAMLRYRRMTRPAGRGRVAHAALTDLRRRGPLGRYRPHVALCVIRV